MDAQCWGRDPEDRGKKYRRKQLPIEWMLLSTVEVKSFEDAQRVVQWYSGRWGIEVYHRTLKSGCRIKDRQFGRADQIETCLGVDMIVAWRIYHLTMLGREVPELPYTVFFKDIEWKAICCYVKKTPVPPAKPPSLREAIYMVGGIWSSGKKKRWFPGDPNPLAWPSAFGYSH